MDSQTAWEMTSAGPESDTAKSYEMRSCQVDGADFSPSGLWPRRRPHTHLHVRHTTAFAGDCVGLASGPRPVHVRDWRHVLSTRRNVHHARRRSYTHGSAIWPPRPPGYARRRLG